MFTTNDETAVSMIHISKSSSHQTVVTIEESTYGLNQSLHLTQLVNNWLHGSMKCTIK